MHDLIPNICCFLVDLNHNNLTISNKIHFQVQQSYLGIYPYGYYNVYDTDLYAYDNYHFLQEAISPSVRMSSWMRRPLRNRNFRMTFFEGQSLTIHCDTHSFFYATGGWLRLMWKNGSRTVFKKINSTELLQPQGTLDLKRLAAAPLQVIANPIGVLSAESYKIHGHLPKVSMEMSHVECFAPVWNNGKWEKYEYKLNVISKETKSLAFTI